MDIFEKHFEMLKENERIFRKYSIKKENGLQLSSVQEKNFYVEGRDLLSDEVINYFLDVRSIHYYRVIHKKLKNYSLFEWIVCLEESVLLEYALPIFSRVLYEYPMLCGMNCEWQIMYEITKINENFWTFHQEWRRFFVEIIMQFFSKYTKEELSNMFSEQYFCQFEKFIHNH